MAGKTVNAEEAHAISMIESLTGLDVVHWDCGEREGVVDLRILTPPRTSIEVKAWTCSKYREATARGHLAAVTGWHPESRLDLMWSLGIDLPTTGSSNQAIPHFTGLRAELIEFVVSVSRSRWRSIDEVLKASPVEEPAWRLAKRWFDLLPAGGSLGSQPVFSSPEAPDEMKQPGVMIFSTTGSGHSADPDSVSEAVSSWFYSGDGAQNLIGKLTRSDDECRHACLVLDKSNDLWWLFDYWGTDKLPVNPPRIPPVVDRVWIVGYSDVVWWYDAATGWGAARGSRPAGDQSRPRPR